MALAPVQIEDIYVKYLSKRSYIYFLYESIFCSLLVYIFH